MLLCPQPALCRRKERCTSSRPASASSGALPSSSPAPSCGRRVWGENGIDTDGGKMGSELSFGLAGRRAIVTGHRGGIGRAIHDVLARDGVEVIGLDLPDFDLSDTATVESRAAALIGDKGVDILVNNAGI